jgi:hypothetical protein
MPRASFAWSGDLTEEEIRRILREGDPEERARLIGRIVSEAPFEEIWRYFTPTEIAANWPVVRRYIWPPDLREIWEWGLRVWGYEVASDAPSGEGA